MTWKVGNVQRAKGFATEDNYVITKKLSKSKANS